MGAIFSYGITEDLKIHSMRNLTYFILPITFLFTAALYSQTQIGSDIDGEAAGDGSGISVSISADGLRVAIGADFNDGTASGAGHVRVYEEVNGSWVQVGSDIDGEAAGDRSGWGVSMSSDGLRVAIGAASNDGTGSNADHVRIWEEVNGSWVQVGNDIDGEAAGDVSGYSVSLSSDGLRVAIGGEQNDGTASDAGHVRVYEEVNGSWVQVGSDIDGEAALDVLGVSVSMSNDGLRVAIGAHRNDGTGTDAGHVRIYELQASLPVSLTSFIATPRKNRTYLEWRTTDEIDNAGFNVEHSINGESWTKIGTVAGIGTTNQQSDYNFEHTNPVTGNNYYRLEQIDFDGTVTYSEVVTVKFNINDAMSIAPNPMSESTGGQVTLSEDLVGEPVVIYDAGGRLVKITEATTRTVKITDLPRGRYIVKVGSFTQWIVVQ